MRRYILGIMHARRCNFFLESISKIDYIDIALAKNYPIEEALDVLRRFALDKRYDYLILTSDDVIIPYNAPAKIIYDCEMYHYPIITGYSRINERTDLVNINEKPIFDIDRKVGRIVWANEYKFLTIRDVLNYLYQGVEIIPVWFVGWSLTAIHRDVLEKWIPIGWYKVRGWIGRYRNWYWASCDLKFSYDVWKMGYEKYADLTVYVPHKPVRREGLLVGIEPKHVEFREKKRNLVIDVL